MLQDHLPPARPRSRPNLDPDQHASPRAFAESLAESQSPGSPATLLGSAARRQYQTWALRHDTIDEIVDYAVAPLAPLGGPTDAVEAILAGLYETLRPETFAEAVTAQEYAEMLVQARWFQRLRGLVARRVAAERTIVAITPTFGDVDGPAASDLARRLVERWTRGDAEAEDALNRRCLQVGIDLGLLLAEARVENPDAFRGADHAAEAANRDAARLLDHFMKQRLARKKEELHNIKHEKAITDAKAAEDRRRHACAIFERRFPSDE